MRYGFGRWKISRLIESWVSYCSAINGCKCAKFKREIRWRRDLVRQARQEQRGQVASLQVWYEVHTRFFHRERRSKKSVFIVKLQIYPEIEEMLIRGGPTF